MADITLYHFDEESGLWTRLYLCDVSLFERAEISAKKGERSDIGSGTVRIFGSSDIGVQPNDKVYVGICGDFVPPSGCKTVVGVTDNRRGSREVRHIRLELD